LSVVDLWKPLTTLACGANVVHGSLWIRDVAALQGRCLCRMRNWDARTVVARGPYRGEELRISSCWLAEGVELANLECEADHQVVDVAG
jgi:hypothetical protein